MHVFPNPAHEIIFSSLSEYNFKSGVVELYGSDGKIVRRLDKREPDTTITLGVADLRPGQYLLRIKAPGCLVSRKIVIE
ncbi:MAG: T9SS type A sorting domain-containing protein [Bacteroidales bacterium]|nr:T9SS type A sorting domain-containing protein [Bacteroidales bacterium]